MKKLKAVVFDLDGTLLDSAYDIAGALSGMLVEAGRAPLSVEAVKPLLGDGPAALCRKAFFATGGAPEEELGPQVRRFLDLYHARAPSQDQVFSGGRELLADLKGKGVKLGVCTNKNDASMRKEMAFLGLAPLFDFMAGGDTFVVRKPHPGHVLGVLDKIGVLPEDSVFIGDGPNDVQAAQEAGVACLLVTHGDPLFGTLGAAAIIDEFADFWPAIQKLGFEG